MKEEMKKVEERLKLRHASNNKFAKTLKRFGGGVESENVRDAFNDMMKEKQALRQRTKTVQKTRKALDSDEDSDESFDSGSDSDSEAEIMDKAALKK
jgi:benzoyl-CoA reductase/2-hydroxyglutaryl-CoA dehydratase subunit BcrC/BadD/HgdB